MKVWMSCDEIYPVYEVYTDGEIYDLEVDIPEELYQKFKSVEKAFWGAQKEIAAIYEPAERAANLARKERYEREREEMYGLEAIERQVKFANEQAKQALRQALNQPLPVDLANLLPKP